MDNRSDSLWQVKLLQPRLPWGKQYIRPADVSDGLCAAMLTREHLLEDANYNKIVPNRFIVELNQDNYARFYKPLEKRLLQQWREKLLVHLVTTNSRQGRAEYRFGGRVQIEIHPATDLRTSQARILSQVLPDPSQPIGPDKRPIAFLELYPSGQRWSIQNDTTSIGRDKRCDVHLGMAAVQEKRLVSGEHAYIEAKGEQYILHDGSQAGKPSLNGTYVNYKAVTPAGQTLKEGDLIILAALTPGNPDIKTEGVVAFRFYLESPKALPRPETPDLFKPLGRS